MVFGKRKSPPVAAFSVPVPRDTIADPNDADLELIATIVDFVNYLFTDGFYRPEELPPHLVQLYHADFYVAQINNGGHSQFVHNCGTRWQMIFANAEAGLAAMGATAQANLMRGLTVWTAANPDKASAQTGFKGGRDSALDILDEAFNRQQVESPVAPRAATWIRSWSGLRLVEPAELRKAWNECARANASRLHRLSETRVGAFQQVLSDDVHLAIGMAVDAANETLFEGRNRETIEVDGRHLEAWIVQTSFRLRGAVCDSSGVRLYALQLGGEGVTWKAAALIGFAGRTDIDQMLSFAEGEPLAMAADLALSRVRPDFTGCIIQPCEPVDGIPNPIFKIVAGDEIFMMTKKDAMYVLAGQRPGEIYDPISLAEIEDHKQGLRDN